MRSDFLKLENVSFSYGQKKVIDNLFLDVRENEIVALIGVSGSGKTTLFRLITHLISPQKGTISTLSDQITYMCQEDLLLPWRSVLSNLLLFSELGRKKEFDPELKRRAQVLLQKVGLAGTENVYPDALSGGMRQRVSLARALLQNRPLLLLDEPFGSLDVLIREELYHLLRQIRDEEKKTMLLVTHDFHDACALADRIVVLGSGKIVGDFAVENKSDQQLTQEIRACLKSVAPPPLFADAHRG